MNYFFRLFFLSITLLTSVGLFMVSPQVALAQQKQECASLQKSIDTYKVGSELPNLPKYCTAATLTRQVLNIGFALIGGVAVLFVMIGGYRYMFAGGNAEQSEKGLKTVLYAIAGLAAVILAVTAVNLVVNLLIYNKPF